MIKIYFLFHSGAFWPSWKSFWNAAENDPEVENKLIYCPVKKQGRGLSGQFDNAEEFLINNGIKYIKISDWNVNEDKPDILVMQTPYDDWHRPRKYYAEEFAKKGIKLVYISYGLEFTETDQSNFDHFKRDFFKNMWHIFSYSEEICENYKKYGNINTALCLGHPKFDALVKAKNENLPKNIIKRIQGRKVVVWHPHFPCLYSKNKNGSKVCSTFSWEDNIAILNYLLNRKDLFTIFMPHHMFFGAFQHKFNISFADILKFQRTIQKSENLLLWRGEYPIIISHCDVYLGERSAVTMEASAFSMPRCYMEAAPEIYNNFGKSALESSFYAVNASQAIDFLNNFQTYKFKNKYFEHFEKYFRPYFDGRCGLNILKNIKMDIKNEKI